MAKATTPPQTREDLVVEGRFQVLLIIRELETNQANHMAFQVCPTLVIPVEELFLLDLLRVQAVVELVALPPILHPAAMVQLPVELLNKHFLEIPLFHHYMELLDLLQEDTLLVVEEQMDIPLTRKVAAVVPVELDQIVMLTTILEVAVVVMHQAGQQEVLPLEELGVLVS